LARTSVKPIPDGYHAATPNLTVDHGLDALAYYERAFGTQVVRKLVLDGKLMHAELRIGDSLITLAEPFPGSVAPDPEQPVHASVLLYTDDVDSVYARAVEAGGTPVNEPSDQFHGDRADSLRDPFGHRWMLATHTEDMSEAEMQRRMEEVMAT
jgi:PhnB protein